MNGPHLSDLHLGDVPAWAFGLGLSVAASIAGLLLALTAEREKLAAARIHYIRQRALPQADLGGASTAFWKLALSGLGHAVLNSGVLSRKAIEDLEQTMTAAGHRTGPALALFIGAKIFLLIFMPLVAWTAVRVTGLHVRELYAVAGGAVVGLMLPDFLVRRLRRQYLDAVEAGLPAALDLLIICAEAGIALEAGLERVAEEGRKGARETANEMRITANEMKILADRRQALLNMGKRTGLESLIRLGGTLNQSLKYGTPLVQALRVLSAEMRQTMLTRYEEKAARIPVMLTIPMILFILPCVFLVVGGPAAVRIIQTIGAQ